MYLLRPTFWKSGKDLTKALRFRSYRLPNRLRPPVLDWHRDFFCGFDSHEGLTILNKDDNYSIVKNYYALNKKGQRDYLNRYTKTPESYEPYNNKYVIRPIRHWGGNSFTISDTNVCRAGYYSAPLFNKTSEWRLFFVKGTLVNVCKKIPSNNTTSDQPWNHTRGFNFSIIRDSIPRIIRHTSAAEDLMSAPIINAAHLVAVDIMMDDEDKYAVLETNFQPSISIQSNLIDIATAFKS